MPNSVVISDTSCLIALSKANALSLLHLLYNEVIITKEIQEEFGEEIPQWIVVETANDKKYQALLETILDKGESSAITLASEKEDVLLILDDLKARKEARKLGYKITGTLGVIYKAKENGHIEKIKPYLDKLKEMDFRISPLIEIELLKLSKE